MIADSAVGCNGCRRKNVKCGMQNEKLGFGVLLVDCGLLPITVSLRGGFCRRGNLPVQPYGIIAVKIEVSANIVPYFEHFRCPALYREIATGLSALAMTVVVVTRLRLFEQHGKLKFATG